MFLAFIKEHNLDNLVVNMAEGRDTRNEATPLCETILCHGGWLAAMLESKRETAPTSYLCAYTPFFYIGAARAAKFLGFAGVYAAELETWAREHPELWGNEFGGSMFCDARAFGVHRPSILKLSDIANHYAAVGKRCLEASEK